MYKILVKMLYIRIKKVIEKVKDGSQSAFFLSNKGLLENILVINEVVDELKRKKRSGGNCEA